ncbi:DUF6884 domain-containing protein [Streptomyces caeruleatus]|uniref:DUF6884 domain-containing protein n=1 Tax=Streptomyces caeruleatus TaxID=661399 RepID=A0A101U5W0_9ACTN|nr:DUF6884 domain-containing protein [Streptomyces caeruleatus]KUO04813.1 hypothetical protein AQJ67_09920 [Streptomyces caeruleatus]
MTTPLPGTLVLAACSRRKTDTIVPVPVLELYAGGIAPQLRERVGDQPDLRQRVFFLSARHGLVGADTPLLPYDQALTAEHASVLRPTVHRQLRWRLDALDVRARLLVVAEPLYLVLIADLLADEDRPFMHWIPDPRGWSQAAAVLDDWNWP